LKLKLSNPKNRVAYEFETEDINKIGKFHHATVLFEPTIKKIETDNVLFSGISFPTHMNVGWVYALALVL
jgi:hypothetical protein